MATLAYLISLCSNYRVCEKVNYAEWSTHFLHQPFDVMKKTSSHVYSKSKVGSSTYITALEHQKQ